MSARTASMVRCSSRRVSASAASDETCSSPVSSSTTLRQKRWRNRYTPAMSAVLHARFGVERPHEHLVEPQRVGAVVAVDLVGRDHVLAALAHAARPPGDFLPVEEERAVTLLDVGRLDVHAAVVEVLERGHRALVVEAVERLGCGHVTEVVEHLVPEARIEKVQHRVLGAADVEVHAAGVAGAHPVLLDGRVDELVRRWWGRGSAGSTSTSRPTAAWCWSRAGSGAARRRDRAPR